MQDFKVANIFGVFLGALVIGQVVGALIGDLLLGNKKSVIIGAILQAVGAFLFTIPNELSLYFGLFMITIGGGLYIPNILSNYGKMYRAKLKRMDRGFILFSLSVNIGAAVGALLIGGIADAFDFKVGFLISGLLFILSILPLIRTKEEVIDVKPIPSFNRSVVAILLAVLVGGFFWAAYDLVTYNIYDIQGTLASIDALGLSKYAWESLGSSFLIPTILIFILIWSFVSTSQFFKLGLGAVSALLAFSFLAFIPIRSVEQDAIYLLGYFIFIAIAEVHIYPIIQAVIAKYGHPKYMAILMSLTFIPSKMLLLLFSFSQNFLGVSDDMRIPISLVLMVVSCIPLIGFAFWLKKNKEAEY